MTTKPELTVIIPVYNRAEVVGKTLRSVAAQTLRPLRVILVDNNSSDSTLSVLQQWKKANENETFIIDVFSEKKPGAAAARNRGLREVDSVFTMFFDSDDLMAAEHCQRVVEGFHTHRNAEIIGWDAVARIGSRTKRLIFDTHEPMWNTLMQGSMATQRYAARTGLFREAGGWDEECYGWNDIEFASRLLSKNPNMVKLGGTPTVEVIYFEDSITGRSFSDGAEKWENSLAKIQANVNAVMLGEKEFERSQRFSDYVNLRRAILAGDYHREGDIEGAHRLMRKTLKGESSKRKRFIYRLAYKWRGLSLPGIARILHALKLI